MTIEALVVSVTEGWLEFGTWERIFSGQVEGLARECRRSVVEPGVVQDHQ